MTLEELQKEWNSIKYEPQSEEELRKMMYGSRFRIFDGLTKKDLLSFCVTMSGFMIVSILFEMFDGWYWSLCWGICFLNIFDEHFGERYMRSLPHERTFLATIDKWIARLRGLLIITRTLYVLILLGLAYLSLKALIEDVNLQTILMVPVIIGGGIYVSWSASSLWNGTMKQLKELQHVYKTEGVNEDSL